MHVRATLVALCLLGALPFPATGALAADPRCTMEGGSGPCKALLERYGYDPAAGTCKEIIWGGCGAPQPFETKEECLQVCGGTKPLVISDVKASSDATLPYVHVTIEYPKSWKDPDVTILVNGQERPFRSWGGGFSPDKNMATYLVFPGTTGLIEIAVRAIAGGKTYEASDRLRWDVASMAGLLDSPGRQEVVFSPRALRFWAFPVDGIRVRFNGQSVTPKLEPLSGKPVGLFSLAPDWRPGMNTLSLEAVGPNGKRVTKEYTFVYLVGGTVAVQNTLTISFGRPGSKSGPFYSLDLAGSALTRVGRVREESYYTLDPEGWLLERTALVQTVRAERPGDARLRILVKHHFLQGEELEQEISIKVVPGGRP
jgi:hypothetical protein